MANERCPLSRSATNLLIPDIDFPASPSEHDQSRGALQGALQHASECSCLGAFMHLDMCVMMIVQDAVRKQAMTPYVTVPGPNPAMGITGTVCLSAARYPCERGEK